MDYCPRFACPKFISLQPYINCLPKDMAGVKHLFLEKLSENEMKNSYFPFKNNVICIPGNFTHLYNVF